MIKLTTTQADNAGKIRHRQDIARQILAAVETRMPPPCKHREGRQVPSCHTCTERRVITGVLEDIRKTGGIE